MSRKNMLLIFAIVLGMLFIVGCKNYGSPVPEKEVNNQSENTSNLNEENITSPFIEPEIFDLLKTNKKIYVIISLKTTNDAIINEFVNSFQENELEIERTGSSWVAGYITKEGFEKIRVHSLVGGIITHKTRTIQENE